MIAFANSYLSTGELHFTFGDSDSESITELLSFYWFQYSSWFKGDLTTGVSCKITASSAGK